MRVFLAALFASAFVTPAFAQSAGLRNFDATYAVRAHGVEVGEATYSIRIEAQNYEVGSRRRTTGLAHLLMGDRQDFDYTASGVIGEDGAVHPTRYQHQGGGSPRVVRVAFGQDIVTTATPPMSMGHPAATAAQKQGAIDQLSMFVRMLTAAHDPCRQSIKVLMDGRTRFDLEFAADGAESVNVAGFRGRAQRCAVQFTPIAGFSDPMQSTQLSFLFAPVNGYFVPVRVEMPSADVGVIRFTMRSFTIDGAR